MFRRRAGDEQERVADPTGFEGMRWWNFRRRNHPGPAPIHRSHEGLTTNRVPDVTESCETELIPLNEAAKCDSLQSEAHSNMHSTLGDVNDIKNSKPKDEKLKSITIGDGDISYSSECSLSTIEDIDNALQESDMLVIVGEEDASLGSKPKKVGLDVAAYMSEREMTPLQEKWNAITVVPNPMFCLYFLLAGKWLAKEAIEVAREAMENADKAQQGFQLGSSEEAGLTFASLAEDALADEKGCIHSSIFPHLHALPPVPVVAVAVGIILHAPFSFLYHWHYACKLAPGYARIDHWSRRLDHSFIHVISACMSYGTSGSWDYFLANLMFNADCIYRQFKPRVRPRMNKIRILISIIAYTIPILRRGETVLFCELWAIFALCGWLFAKYPIGGYSHSAFHAVIALAPPLLMQAACHLLASKEQIQVAARCAVLAGK